MHIETMTLNKLAQYFRSIGLPTSEAKLADGIEQGVYPFGVCIHSKKGRIFEIYRRKVDEWVSERAL